MTDPDNGSADEHDNGPVPGEADEREHADETNSGPDFGGADAMDLDLVMDVPVTMQVVLGSTRMSVAELLKLRRGSIVKLDTRVGEPVEVEVNGRIVAKGEIVVLDQDEQRFGITLTEVATPGAKPGAKKAKAA